MTKIRMARWWTLGSRIGDPSGFGRVFEGTADDGTIGVVKLIPKDPGAERELLFVDVASVPNVVPIIDTGETAADWGIAMPRAVRSLRAELEATGGGPLAPDRALPILVDIATALAGLAGRVVHRDLKPENVLLLEGSWCLADFGIARYAEKTTAPVTRKGFLSPPYAAPEVWRYERATGATDVYALGVIAFELLTGHLPFQGPDASDFRDQHLNQAAPSLPAVAAPLASLVQECLLKPQESRPRPNEVLDRLRRLGSTTSPGVSRLQQANAHVVMKAAERAAQASASRSQADRQNQLVGAATSTLKVISDALREAVITNASSARPKRGTIFDEWALELGGAVIGMDPPKAPKPQPWGAFTPAFDVAAYAGIGIEVPTDQYGFRGRAHSLWYCDAVSAGVYRWYETGFMVNPMMPKRTAFYPVAFAPGEDAGKAVWAGIAEWQVAWPFTPIDQGNEGPFIERWLEWFGQAATGVLTRPSHMPEARPEGSWRR